VRLRGEAVKSRLEQIDYLDLLISVLGEHERRMDGLNGELTLIASRLISVAERLEGIVSDRESSES